MKLKDYCKDRVTRLLGTLVVLFILSEFLYIVGNTFASIFLIDLTIISILFIKNLIEWYRRKEYLYIFLKQQFCCLCHKSLYKK